VKNLVLQQSGPLELPQKSSIKELGILHNIALHHGNVEMVLDFHVFDISDFDFLIGHP
jgi:hypothetical protein